MAKRKGLKKPLDRPKGITSFSMKVFAKHYELISGVVSGATLMTLSLGFGTPIWMSLLASGLLFGGMSLIGSNSRELQLAREAINMNQNVLDAKIKVGRKMVSNLKKLSRKIDDRQVRDKLNKICDLADNIFDNFDDDETDVTKAGRFLLYLERFLPVIEGYARLSSTPEGRRSLAEMYEEGEFLNFLDTMEKGFSKGFQNYLRNDVVELKTVSRVLEKMIGAAEIGK
jgi:5-bromo-4-chloroindolyl phosphate hydrolysis protein